MCIARVGRVLRVDAGKGTVEFFDGKTAAGVDVSLVRAASGAYVEVFGDLALSVLSQSEARKRKSAWVEIRRAAGLPLTKAA
jgi:hydrogenase maturation factor